jgi:hypothetical protein
MSALIETGEHPVTSTAPRSEGAVSPSQRPEFFQLPKVGGDPHFGLGRSYYYEGEKQGYWHLIRIRQRGKVRGVTLVPYDIIAAYIRKQGRANPDTHTLARKAAYLRKRTGFAKAAAQRTPTASSRKNREVTIGGKQ